MGKDFLDYVAHWMIFGWTILKMARKTFAVENIGQKLHIVEKIYSISSRGIFKSQKRIFNFVSIFLSIKQYQNHFSPNQILACKKLIKRENCTFSVEQLPNLG